LSSRPRYQSLFQLDKGDYKLWAKGLKDAGYATDPKYPDKLIGIIERYQLNKYDSEVLGVAYVATPIPKEEKRQLLICIKFLKEILCIQFLGNLIFQ